MASCLLSAPAAAASAPNLAEIIDDPGNRAVAARRVAALPRPVTGSVLPHTPHAAATAGRCHRAGPGCLRRGHARPRIADRIRAGLAGAPVSPASTITWAAT